MAISSRCLIDAVLTILVNITQALAGASSTACQPCLCACTQTKDARLRGSIEITLSERSSRLTALHNEKELDSIINTSGIGEKFCVF